MNEDLPYFTISVSQIVLSSGRKIALLSQKQMYALVYASTKDGAVTLNANGLTPGRILVLMNRPWLNPTGAKMRSVIPQNRHVCP
jgi:hypothetical protein